MSEKKWAVEAFGGLLDDLGVGAEAARAELAEYAAERAAHLSAIVNEPGFPEAVRAERDNVALKAGILAAEVGDEVNQGLLAALAGGLGFAARAIAGLA